MDGQEFKDVRNALGLTQKALAAELDVSEVTIQNYENKRSAVPRAIELAIAELLRRQREERPARTLADWEEEFRVLLGIERAAFRRMVDNRPYDSALVIPSVEKLDNIEKWQRYCAAWKYAHDELQYFMARFRKEFLKTQ